MYHVNHTEGADGKALKAPKPIQDRWKEYLEGVLKTNESVLTTGYLTKYPHRKENYMVKISGRRRKSRPEKHGDHTKYQRKPAQEEEGDHAVDGHYDLCPQAVPPA